MIFNFSIIETYVIHWFGPYHGVDVKFLPEKSVIYLVTGLQKSKKVITSEYIGITEQFVSSRFNDKTHKPKRINRKKEIWVGKLQNKRPLRSNLEIIESVLVYFWQPDLNDKKKCRPPNDSTAILNLWHTIDDVLRKHKRHAAQKLHDFIYWDGELWHVSERLKVYEDQDI